MKKMCLMMVGIVVAWAVGAQASLYSNSCDSLAGWNDNSSGAMTLQSGGPSGTYIQFIGNGGATMTLVPNAGSQATGVNVQAGDKLVVDIRGWAQDFSINYVNDGNWTNLTGVPGNPWIYMGSNWQHFEFTFPVSGLANYLSFNIYASGQQIGVDNLAIVPEPVTLSLLGSMGLFLVARRRR
jgi:hypothetical protein